MKKSTSEGHYFSPACLVDRLDGEMDLINQIVTDSIPVLDIRIKKLALSWQAQDWPAIKSDAHSIKGLSQMISFNVLSFLAKQMETYALQVLSSDVDPHFDTDDTIDKMYEALRLAEKEYLKLDW